TSTLTMQDKFSRPFGIVFAPNGTLYVETDRNPEGLHTAISGSVWRINTSSGEATPVAANIGRPRGMVVLSDGRIVISDYQRHVVQILNPTTGAVTLLAGAL